MLKKTLIGLVVLSVLAFLGKPVLAAEQDTGDDFRLKAHSWPVEFKTINLDFTIPVNMDVGLYFEINNKKEVVDEGITIEQISIHIYEGCSIPMNIQTNFCMVLGASIAPTSLGEQLIGDDTEFSVEIRDEACESAQPDVPKTLSDTTEKRTIYVKLVNPKVFELDFGKGKHVADVTLNVKPGFQPGDWVDP